MKNIYTILLLLKESYKKEIEQYSEGLRDGIRGGLRDGLCYCASRIENISAKEYSMFKEYLNKALKDQKVFYLSNGQETEISSLYMFPLSDTNSRLEWLDKHIELNKPKEKNTKFQKIIIWLKAWFNTPSISVKNVRASNVNIRLNGVSKKNRI